MTRMNFFSLQRLCVVGISALLLLQGGVAESSDEKLPSVGIADFPPPCAYPTRPGSYRLGEWQYSYAIRAWGRSEGREGRLVRRGEEVRGRVGQVLETPLGKFQYFDGLYTKGWLNTLARDGAVFVEDRPFAAIIQGNGAFAADLYRRLRQEPGNLFFSPFSVSTALGMTYGGACGATAEEMANTLHFLREPDAFQSAYRRLIQTTNGFGIPHVHQLVVASSLWGNVRTPFLSSFEELCRDKYGARLRSVDFVRATEYARQQINRWVENETHGRIRELLSRDALDPNTRLVLTNAIYFQAAWDSPFQSDKTQKEDFTISATNKISVAMMHQAHEYEYFDGGDFQLLALPYEGNALSMLVLLPRKLEDLDRLEKSLSWPQLVEWLNRAEKTHVNLSLPRFRIGSAFQLEKELPLLGMKLAFTDGADFSGISKAEGLKIDKVIHKAWVDVNEEGTEAAAATAAVMTRKSLPPKAAQFRADHPFLFIIQDHRTGLPLFLGRLADPSQVAQ